MRRAYEFGASCAYRMITVREIINNKWSKSFDNRPHRRGGPFTGKANVTLAQSAAMQSAVSVALMQLGY